MKKQVWNLDSQIPVGGIQSMDDLLAVSVAEQRFNMLLLASFAALAVALAGVGIYGMVAYRVNQRTHEIGVYMALGAQHRDVLRLVMNDGVKLALAGIVHFEDAFGKGILTDGQYDLKLSRGKSESGLFKVTCFAPCG